MHYSIEEKLVKRTKKECLSGTAQYVAVLTSKQWEEEKDSYSMVVDMDIVYGANTTKVEINYDSLTGNFCIPDRQNIAGDSYTFAFVLDENGVVFIDDGSYVNRIVEEVQRSKKWRFPSLERFLYDFMEKMVSEDLKTIEEYDAKLEVLEKEILEDQDEDVIEKLNEVRDDMLDLKTHYEQMIDLVQELEENENNYFKEENLRYFHLLCNRLERYYNRILALREHGVQVRDLYQNRIDEKQNKIMAVLTIITTIFFPLSLVTSWYGMNFEYMPELAIRWAYPALVVICAAIIVTELIIFKKKKWI